MPQDAFHIRRLVQELNTFLKGGKINRISQVNKDELTFIIYTGKTTVKLILSTNASNARVCLSLFEKEPAPIAPNFCMLLRKHLLGAEILEIRQYFWAKEEPVLFMDTYFDGLAKVEGTVDMDTTIPNKKAVVMTDGTDEIALANGYAFEIGRAGYVWALDGKLISDVYFVDELLATVYDGDYAGWTTAATETKDVAPNFVAEAKNAVVYINGVKSSAGALEKGAEVRLFDTPDAKGKTDGKIDLVIALQEDVEVVGAAGVKTTTGKDGKEYVTVAGVVGKTETKNVVGYEDVAAKDVVLSVTMPTGITYLTVADSVIGQMTKRNIKTNTIIFDGAEYGESELTYTDVNELFHSGNQNAKTNYTLWLDRGGYAIWDSKIVDPDLYAVVLDTDYVYASAKKVTYYADLLYIDGTTDTVVTDTNYAASKGEWVTYTTNAKGQIELDNVNTAVDADVTIDGKTAALGANRATEDTIYLVQSGTPGNYTYDAYVGFENVPAMTAHGLNIVETDETNGLGNVIASHVFVASSDVYTKKDVVVYTLEDEDIWSWKDQKGNDYYEVPVLVDGEDDSLIFVNVEPADVLMIGYYEDIVVNTADGIVAELTEAEYTSEIASIDYADKTVEVGGKVWNAGEAMIFEIANSNYELIDLDDVDVNDDVVYKFTGKYITEMYILPANEAAPEATYTVNGVGAYKLGEKVIVETLNGEWAKVASSKAATVYALINTNAVEITVTGNMVVTDGYYDVKVNGDTYYTTLASDTNKDGEWNAAELAAIAGVTPTGSYYEWVYGTGTKAMLAYDADPAYLVLDEYAVNEITFGYVSVTGVAGYDYVQIGDEIVIENTLTDYAIDVTINGASIKSARINVGESLTVVAQGDVEVTTVPFV